ncbi:MAG: DUF1588 domain-containing protein, partial [Planctomycetota bacterium]
CHGAEKPKGKFQLQDLTSKQFQSVDVKRWQIILEMVDLGDMPPAKRPQPTDAERESFEAAVNKELQAVDVAKNDWEKHLPKYANRIDHDSLFSGRHKGPAFTKARAWRINGNTYSRLMKDLELGFDFVVPLQPNDEGFKDYARLYADEATIRTMMQNAKRVADAILYGKLRAPKGASERDPNAKAGRFGSRYREIKGYLAIDGEPTRPRLDEITKFAFQLLLSRQPSSEELKSYVDGLLVPNLRAAGNAAGLRGLLVAVLISPEFVFRAEVGLGKKLPDGRRMLSADELAYALSFALHDHPMKSMLQAARDGKLRTRADVERAFRALIDDPKLYRGRSSVAGRKFVWQSGKDHRSGGYAKPRMIRFFQEYLGYTKAPDIFKDDTRHGGKHQAGQLIKDADWTILHILAEDRNVLEELLTTDRFAMQEARKKKKKKRKNAKNNDGSPDETERPSPRGYQDVYNITQPSELGRGRERLQMPERQRAGLLTHPAWLVTYSTNFHTDPVRRGKWIMEHLLGYPVPELPIAVQAQLPDWHDKTIRQRFSVVKAESCWRCHKKMNPLGEPFEAYDDFGRWRRMHLVGTNGNIVEAEFEKLGRRNPKHVKEAQPKIPVDTTGELYGTGDPKLDGPVRDAVDLMHRLAKSVRVRQVFVRHIFRYWMGRNETLDDSPTLMAMDRAYVGSGGSFKETLVALVTSDSFLYRK